MILNIAKKSSRVVSPNTSMQVRQLPLNNETLPTCLAEYRSLANHVGSLADDFWTVFYDSHNVNLFHPGRAIVTLLCELPMVRSLIPSVCASLYQVTSDSFRSPSSTAAVNDTDISRIPPSDARGL